MKKPGPKPHVKKSDKAKVRGITASDTEWRWVIAQAMAQGVSVASFVRSLIQKAMRDPKPSDSSPSHHQP